MWLAHRWHCTWAGSFPCVWCTEASDSDCLWFLELHLPNRSFTEPFYSLCFVSSPSNHCVSRLVNHAPPPICALISLQRVLCWLFKWCNLFPCFPSPFFKIFTSSQEIPFDPSWPEVLILVFWVTPDLFHGGRLLKYGRKKLRTFSMGFPQQFRIAPNITCHTWKTSACVRVVFSTHTNSCICLSI